MKARQSEKWLREHLGHLQPSVITGPMLIRVEDETSGLLRGVLLETSALRRAPVRPDRLGATALVAGARDSTRHRHALGRRGARRRDLGRAGGGGGARGWAIQLFGAGDVRRAHQAWSQALERARAAGIPGAVEHLEPLMRDTAGMDRGEAQQLAATWARDLVEEERIPPGTVDLAYFDRPRG